MRRKWIWIAPLAIVAMVGFIALGGELVMLLWNWLLPPLFGWHAITFWQALGILLLCRILVGAWGHGGGHRNSMQRRIGERMADRVAERWQGMTPEERERFRERLRQRCGFDPIGGESKAQ